MKIAILLNSYGIEALAKGQPTQYWHYNGQGVHDEYEPPKDCLKVGEYTVDESKLPRGPDAVRVAIETLKAKQQEVMAGAQSTITDLQKKINDLLMLGAPAPTPEPFDDIPF